MQAFKLVNGGFVDKVIVFDTLPERFTTGVRTKEVAGFPRAWAKWLASIGSTRTVFKTETSVDLARNWTFKYTPIGKEPCFFVLEYQDLNADKQRWHEICDYLRANVGPEVRLKEKIDEMALALAPNSTAPLDVECEDIAVIAVPIEAVVAPSDHEVIAQDEQILIEEAAPKKRGRPKKQAVEA